MTYHIHLFGQVQGVGFRPFVYRLAKEMDLKGWVSNGNDGLHIELTIENEILEILIDKLLKESPPLAKIKGNVIRSIPDQFFENFEIRKSDTEANPYLLITPDVATCSDCRQELLDHDNRRYQYPFITCTNCGVRYSIIERLPYDRANTAMREFEQCSVCEYEYNNVSNRMYYSQTNSCSDCGVQMDLYENNKVLSFDSCHRNVQIIQAIVRAWENGKIVAIKGIGGYLLTCDASNPKTIQTLRSRKKRPSKPFALMYPGIEEASRDFILGNMAESYLQSPESPILLLPLQENKEIGISRFEIAPHLDHLGVMLPYSPLFILLLTQFKKPIVATSGNLSNSPIIYEDEAALQNLKEIADLMLVHNRKIIVPQDDSVLSFKDVESPPIVLRRARGFAPSFIQKDLRLNGKTILALGAELKSTFALSHQTNLYVSQYLGDLESFETQENYKKLIAHFFNLFQTEPELIVIDKHPAYFSSQLGKFMAEDLRTPIRSIQHHIAHFGAVLAENDLLDSQKKVLGVIWDGTGLGDDGNIWGGEFFIYEKQSFMRAAHFPYFPMILGDKMPREPRISALCAFHQVEGAAKILEDKFTSREWPIYQQLLGKNTLKTSSIGRLFDAVASLLGLMDRVSYEGEAAMLLETLAWQYFKKNASMGILWVGDISPKKILEAMVADILAKKDSDYIAFKFHVALVEIIRNQAASWRITKIAFSGGVFQNHLLVTLIKKYLIQDFELFFHRQLSPNDENIAFGQLILGQENYLIN